MSDFHIEYSAKTSHLRLKHLKEVGMISVLLIHLLHIFLGHHK